MGFRPGNTLKRRFLAGLFALTVVVVMSAAGLGGTAAVATQTQEADYRIDSVSKLDYYNSRGFEDRNGDGRVVLAITAELDMSKSRDPTLTYGGDAPLVITGDGGFSTVPAPLISSVPADSRLVLDSITIRDVSADEPEDDVIGVASPVTLRDVTITDTVHEARYPADTFSETHRVSVVDAGGSVTVTDSAITKTGQAVAASGDLTVESSRIHDVDTADNGALRSGGRATVVDSTISSASGARGGAVNADSVRLDNATLRNVDAGFSGGGVNSGSTVIVLNSTIDGAHARRNGGAIAADGRVTIRRSRIVDAHADQDNSLYAYGARLAISNSTIEDADTVSFGKGGISYGSISVRDSRLVETSRLHASEIRIERTTVNGSLSLYGQEFEIRESNFRRAGSVDGYRVTIADSTLRGVPKIAASDTLTVEDSFLIDFGGFRSSGEQSSMALSNVTIYEVDGNAFPTVGDRSLSHVNVLEAEQPVFAGTLPDRSTVFVDTVNDTETPPEWDADVFWSREEPFPAAAKLPVVADAPTPTAAATRTATASETTPRSTDAPSPRPTSTPTDAAATAPASDDPRPPSDGGLPFSLPALLAFAVGTVLVVTVVLVVGIATS